MCIFALTAWQPFAPSAPPEPPAKVAPRAWQATENAVADIIITAQGFPDLSPARTPTTKEAKTRFVVAALIAHANAAQAQLRTDLATRKLSYFPLWISNQIAVRNVSRAHLQWLAARADVARIELDEQTKGIEVLSDEPRAMNNELAAHSASLSAIEWGVQRVNAPEVWAMGYTGQGIVIANLDTGVRWDHDALKPKYRGWNGTSADHNYNWFDAAPDSGSSPSASPVDVNGHGTHTTGTAIGDDGAGNQIGIAPGARWIGCRNMAGPGGIGSVARYTVCFQFALAPTDVNGNAPDPGKGADITSNSWGCDPAFGEAGCNMPTALVTVTQVLRDAGVMVVASAGNEGGSCGTVINAPATLDQSFTVGATDSANVIAPFSSRGPSSLTGKVKPDLVAPGVNVRSARSFTTSAYGPLSGTSMAAPHVAGVIALLWSAAPWLRGDIDATEAILRQTTLPLADATTCSGVPGSATPNNTYGYGLIDALAAVNRAAAPLALVTAAPPVASVLEPISFTLALTNAHAITRTNVVVTTSLPLSATLLASFPPGTVSDDSLTWQFASLDASASVTMTFVVSAPKAGWIANANVRATFDGLSAPIPGTPATTLIYRLRVYAPALIKQM
jgi:subtilisin family serine protease